MAETPGSKDKSLEALDFIINVLKEHEQILDTSIHELATITEQLGDTDALKCKMEKIEEKIGSLQKEMTNLVGYKSSVPKQTLPVGDKKQETPVQTTAEVSTAIVQSDVSMVLGCKNWSDFQVLATRAQTLTFNIKEPEKIFQVDAFSGKQIITYTGALPDFSVIFKTWLSRQLDSPEQNVLEGFLDKPK